MKRDQKANIIMRKTSDTITDKSPLEEEISAFVKILQSDSEEQGTTKTEKVLIELAKVANDLITRLYKAKRSLNAFIYEIMGSSKGVNMLKELNEDQIKNFVDIILNVINHGKLKDDQVVCLRLLSNLIYDNYRTRNHIEAIFPAIIDKCRLITEEPKISRQAFNCLGNLLGQCPDTFKSKSEFILSIIIPAFHKVTSYTKPEITSHTSQIQVVVRCLSYCLSYPKILPTDTLEEIFMKVYRLLFIGTPYANFKIASGKTGTTTAATALTSASSGSEVSDTDETESGFDKYGKVRVQSLMCIQQMCRLNSKFIFEKWHLLLSRHAFNAQNAFGNKWELDSESIKKLCINTEPHILILMQLSKDSKVKAAAATTIGSIIEHSPMKTWQGSLGIPKDSHKKKLSHLSLSEILGNVTVNLHYILPYYLDSETDQTVRVQLLKSISILLSITQYQKIPEGLITYILSKTVWKFLEEEKEKPILSCAINCFTSVANQKYAYTEFEKEFLNYDSKRSIIRFVLILGTNDIVGRSMDCLTLLSKITKNYSQSLQAYWPILWPYIDLVLKDQIEQTTLGSIGFIEEYIKHYNEQIYMNQSSPGIELFQSKELVTLIQNWIHELLSSPESNELQINIIDVLGIMSELQWQMISKEATNIAVNFILNFNGTGMAQSVVLKAIGNMVTYKMFNEDKKFISKVVEKLIVNKSDKTMIVGIKNSWALANLCYCLEDLAKLDKFAELAECALGYSQLSKEKICCNGIRALGYVLKKADFKKSKVFKLPLNSVLKVIISHLSAKTPKISWNSCVAIGNVLSNPTLPTDCILYFPETFNALIDVIANRPNIKTKMHAIQALKVYKSKEEYGTSFEKLVIALINVYENIGKMQLEDVTEYKYRDKFETTIIDSLCYMLNIRDTTETEADFISQSILNNHAGELLAVIVVYLQRLLKIETKEETKIIIQESETILNNIKGVMRKVSEWIKKSTKAHVSFGVVDQVNELATAAIENYPNLQTLVITKVKPKFIQSFQ